MYDTLAVFDKISPPVSYPYKRNGKECAGEGTRRVTQYLNRVKIVFCIISLGGVDFDRPS
jgi:hypothetical protein